ncbi:crossover junction endonuclease EME1 isoform X2 [Hypanus sabinus]|nr:crossover junction endonuclease EME1 isoform X2 [Hypanus sabinus]XP_059804988.1 crossover junction endonuclease EME1 isoform X2 [Hypanus sabinus]
MLWCNDSENEASDTNLDDSTKLPAINFTGVQSCTISDGPLDFKCGTPKRAAVINVGGSDFRSYDLALSNEVECCQLDPSHSSACLSNEVVTVVNSESDDEEILEIPLSKRLKIKLGEKMFDKPNCTISNSSQENYSQVHGRLQCSQIDPKIKLADVIELKDQTREPSLIHQRAVPSRSTWSISDSDDELCVLQPVKSCEPYSNSNQSCINDLASCKDLLSAGSNHKKRVKQTSSEMGRAKQEALKKCQEREQKRAEKENIRRQREEEKATRKMLAGIEKMLRPGECLKHIQVSIDPGLLQIEGAGQLLSTLQAMEVSCVIENQTIPHSVVWRRRQSYVVEQQMNEVTDWIDELHVIIHIPPEEFVSMVHVYKQELEGAATEGQETLEIFAVNILQQCAGRVPCLVIVDLEKHFSLQKKQKSQKRHVHTTARNGQDKQSCEHNISPISRMDVELALVHLQMSVGIQVQLLETWKEFADYVSMFTKAVAEAPFKRARDNKGLSVYLENDGSRGVKVDRSGKGLLTIWKKQIQQLNRVSSEMADAIVSAYPSPWSLTQAYQECTSEQEKEKLLADILVRRGEGTTSTTRRIGLELSKRVYLLMNSLEPESFLE